MNARLRDAIDAGYTIVTATARLARHVRLDLARSQAGRDRAVWSPPPILGWQGWLAQLHEDLRWSRAGASSVLLNPTQEQRIWEQVIEEDDSDAPSASPSTARQARAAWELVHAWHLPDLEQGVTASEEVQAFARWMRGYRQRCRAHGWLDRARLPDTLRAAISAQTISVPRGILLLGFEYLSPQQRALLRALEERDVQVAMHIGSRRTPSTHRVELSSPEHELTTAARWANRLLTTGEAEHICIVVPQLAARRDLVQRLFDVVFMPGAALPGRHVPRRPYQLSAAPLLADHAIVRAARVLLTILRGRIDPPDLSRVLRMPFVAGGITRAPQRALLDAWLRRQGLGELDVRELPRCVAVFHESCRTPSVDVALPFERIGMEMQRPGTRCSVDIWAAAMRRCLEAFGWPGERALNTEEQAAVTAFQAALVRFSSTELVQGPIDVRDALSQLAAVLTGEPMGGDYPAAPVQVLEMTETWGLEFGALWVSGMDDETWPPAADPNPFIPMEWHRKYRLPAGTPEVELERAQRITQRLLSSADRVIVSHAVRDGDRSLGPTALVRGIERLESKRLDLAPMSDVDRRPRDSVELESLHDERAPSLRTTERTRGGTRVLKLQAACPFRAYGELRLEATGLQAEQPFPDARVRGTLLHGALERLWRKLRSSQALFELDAAALEAVLATAAGEALQAIELAHGRVLKPRRRSVEMARLERAMRDWLAVERERAPFEVHALEAERTVTLAAMELRTRADRIDRLADDTLVIIDYKSGAAERRAPGCWLGARPDEPQVPLYALAETEPLAGAFIGHVRPGSAGFSGAANLPGIVPGVAGEVGARPLTELRAHWRESLGGLAAAFAGGDARVDPKHGNQTCRRCDLGPLCRIAETSGEVADG